MSAKNPRAKVLEATTLSRARALRRDPPDAEKKLWRMLRDRRLDGVKFRRQFPIGRYISDFCCIKRRLIVELDGGQHAERAEYDLRRTASLESRGFRVLRFWNAEVRKEPDALIDRLVAALEEKEAEPSP
jgi:very-short-patch-repair endonuclease